MPQKHKTYSIGAIYKVWSSIPINAISIEDAVAQAKKLNILDFVKIYGEHLDSSFNICSVYNNDDTDTTL